MAFGLTRQELTDWKRRVAAGEIAFLTHFWLEPRFPGVRTVTKVGCANERLLTEWCEANGLNPAYIHRRAAYPHFDLIGSKQKEILAREGLWDQIARFGL